MTDYEASRDIIIGAAAAAPGVAEAVARSFGDINNMDPAFDATERFAILAKPVLAWYGLETREDADAVLIRFLAELVQLESRLE